MDLRRELEGLHCASFGWALSCCRHQRQDAEDVLQTVYVKVLEGRARFDGRSTFRTWLFGVIHLTAHEWRRRHWLRSVLFERWLGVEMSEHVAAEPPSVVADENSRLRELLAQLPRRQREVLHLVFYQDMTLEEAAQAIGVSLGSARTHYHRGKERLRSVLREGLLP